MQLQQELVALQSAAVRREGPRPGDVNRACRALVARRLAELGVDDSGFDMLEQEFVHAVCWMDPSAIASFVSIVARAAKR